MVAAGAAFNQEFCEMVAREMLFGSNGREHEAHSVPIDIAIRFSSPTATMRATVGLTLDAMRHPESASLYSDVLHWASAVQTNNDSTLRRVRVPRPRVTERTTDIECPA
jgi:hypothetical protein